MDVLKARRGSNRHQEKFRLTLEHHAPVTVVLIARKLSSVASVESAMVAS